MSRFYFDFALLMFEVLLWKWKWVGSVPFDYNVGQTGTVFITHFDLWWHFITLFFKTAKPFMVCFTGNICHILSLMLYELNNDSDVPVTVVKKITNVLWTACTCQLVFNNLNTYTTIIKYKSTWVKWKFFACMRIIQSI